MKFVWLVGDRRHVAALALVVFAALTLFAPACSSSKSPAAGGPCHLNSDCDSPLVCALGACRKECLTAADCISFGPGSSCINDSKGNAVCQPAAELNTPCDQASDCHSPLACASDYRCRDLCTTAADCNVDGITGRLCASDANGVDYCADPGAVTNGMITEPPPSGAPDASVVEPASTGDGGANGQGDGGTSVAPGTDGAASGDATLGDAGAPDANYVATCSGPALTEFGHVAVGDSNPGYGSGLAVRSPTDMLIFSGYAGPDRTSDADAPANVTEIDVQRFDLATAKSEGPSSPVLTADADGSLVPFKMGDGTGIGVQSAAVGLTPTGDIVVAIVVAVTTAAATENPGYYVVFLDSNLTVQQSTEIAAPFTAWSYGHVAWENGEFVVTWTHADNSGIWLQLALFHYDGSNAGSASTVPTDDPNGLVAGFPAGSGDMGSVAFVGNVFGVVYGNAAGRAPMLTLLDPTTGAEIGTPASLNINGLYSGNFIEVGSTPQGFIVVEDGDLPDASSQPQNPTNVVATFVSPTGTVGATYSFPGGPAVASNAAARAASDGTGAGFVLLDPSGSANFVYITGDGSTHLGPQTILQEANVPAAGDLVSISSLPGAAGSAGRFGVGLYSRAEHLTRMAVSGCPQSASDAGP
jgi:hypothetical protein